MTTGVETRVLTRSAMERLDDQAHSVTVGSAADPLVCAQALEGCHTVIWCAGNLLPASPIADLVTIDDLTPLMTLLRESACQPGRRFIFLSSGGTVYGPPDRLPVPETHPLRPISLYGAVKVRSEQLIESAEHSVLDTTILRCGNVYGPGQRPRPTHGVIAHALEAALDNRPMPMIGCLESVRDYVYIDDVVSVILACVRGDVRAPVLNVGSGIGTSLHYLFDTIRSITGSLSTTQGPPRAADISSIVLDIAALRRQIPTFEPTALEVGLERTWQASSRAQSTNTNVALGSRALESPSVHRPNLEHLGVV